MADGKAALDSALTAPVVRSSPRFLLPRASGAAGLPAQPSRPPSCSPDLVLACGGIVAKFDGWPVGESSIVQDLWGQWVAKLRPLHEPLWRELGILEGILASTYFVRRGSEGALLQLVPFWSPETNTFVFPWGEATVTLEDVAVLAGLPLVGFPVREQLQKEDERALRAARRLLSRTKSGQHFPLRHQRGPVEEAASGGGRDDEELLEHGTFLSVWLSRFVLPSPPFSVVPREELIPIAVRLARGQTVALAPAALASIYRDLSALKRHLVCFKRTAAPPPLVSAPMHIVQLWVWERFPELRSPVTAAGIPDSAGGDVMPRAARWHEVVGKAMDPGYVHSVLVAPKKFEWRPYGSRALKSFARCLHPCELVGMDCIEQHNPHRVARQLGFDQDVPGIVTRPSSDSWEKAWETYDVGAGHYAFAVPSDKPGVTDEYAQWWNKPHSMSCATATADKVHKEILDGQNKNVRENGDILTLNKELDSLLEDSVEAMKRGSGMETVRTRLAGWQKETLDSVAVKFVLLPPSSKTCNSSFVHTDQGQCKKTNMPLPEHTRASSLPNLQGSRTLYYLRESDRSKEAWAMDDANSSTGAGRAVGTMEMIQKASEKRQAEIAELDIMIEKLAIEIQEAEAAEPSKK